MKKYNTYSFVEYPPIEILGTDIYLKSIKRLSFQYRTKEGDNLVAYVALSKENIPLNIPNIGKHMNGCRILSIYVGAEIINGYEVDNVALRMALLDEAEYFINGWVDSENNANFIFDYFWFYNEDIKKGEIIDEIGYMTTVNDISFKLVNRHNAK
ncbi:MAG: hypothetical protein IKY35_05375 [Muribaculaceae bacterium]|nr:hypothetical protein [Muribaculaceae bacterium]